MAGSEAAAPRKRSHWRRTKAAARICWRLFIWLVAGSVAGLGWWLCIGMFLVCVFSAYLSQLIQDPKIWSDRQRAFPRALGAAFRHASIFEATINLVLAVGFLSAAAWAVFEVWHVDISWLLTWYGLASSIQCLHWRRLAIDEDVYFPIPVFLTMVRDLADIFGSVRRRNRNWADHYPLRRNDGVLDSARRDTANTGQGSEHLQ